MPTEIKSIFVPTKLLAQKQGFTHYDAEVDGIQFSNDVQAAINEYVDLGYSLKTIQPIISTVYYARTYTEGMLLIFEREHDPV